MKLEKLDKIDEQGQGLVEYALILVLVAVVVIGVLLNLGPVVGEVFSKINQALNNPGNGVITGITAARTGGGGNAVKVTITVSTVTEVTVSDSQNGAPQTATCNSSCTVTIGGVGSAAGTITVTAAEGGIQSVGYPAG